MVLITRAQAVGLVLAVGALSACVQETPSPSVTASTGVDETVATTTQAPEDSAVTTTAGPTGAELEDQGQEEAAETVEQFWAELDELSQDPDIKVQELATVARGQAVAQWVSNIRQRRDADQLQTGDTKVTVTAVETVTKGERYEVTACLDWSDVKVNSVKPDRGEAGDRQQITYVVRPDVGSDELFVTDDPMEYEACEG